MTWFTHHITSRWVNKRFAISHTHPLVYEKGEHAMQLKQHSYITEYFYMIFNLANILLSLATASR